MAGATRTRETSAQRAKRQWEELMQVATSAGYVNPYPAPGTAPVVTIHDRCDGCGWTMYVAMRGEVYCPNPKCAEHHKVYAPVDGDAS